MEKINFIVSYNTDKGIRKLTNQDALLMKVNNTPNGRVGLFVVCDGMGGLEQGELASATVIRGLDKWYEEEFEGLLKIGAEEARKSLVEKVYELNSLLLNPKFSASSISGSNQNFASFSALTIWICILFSSLE